MAAIEKEEDLPVTNEDRFQLSSNDGDSSEGAAQQAATAAPSSLLVAHRQPEVSLARQNSADTGRKPTKTYAEMIACYKIIEPTSNINSKTIEQNEVSIADNSCATTGRVQQSCGTSGQLPNLVPGQQIKSDAKEPEVGDRKKPSDQSIEDNPETNSFRCHICQMTFSRKVALTLHMCAHTGSDPYKCEVCDAVFSQLGCLKYHYKSHAGLKPYECQVCKKTFLKLSNFKRHGRVHTGEKPYQCRLCQKTFSENRQLKTHSRMHSGEKPYECQVCKKTFVEFSYLRYHLRIHTGEKPYECRVCKRTFTRSIYLKSHFKSHTGEKPYRCQVCQMAFRESGQLTSHCRSHTGEKPYQCQVCQRSFAQKTHLNRHGKLHTREKTSKCQVCKKKFSNFASFEQNSAGKITCPPCAKIRCEGQIGSCSNELESSFEIKLDPDYVLAADQAECDIDKDQVDAVGRNEYPFMFPDPIKEEITESVVDPTDFVAQDERFVFLDETIEIKSEVDEAEEGSSDLATMRTKSPLLIS